MSGDEPIEEPDSSDPSEEIYLSPKGRTELDQVVAGFRKALVNTAWQCAEQSELDNVSAKHIKDAKGIVYQTSTRDRPLSVDPYIWWLGASLAFALALAIPDAGAMFFGDPLASAPHWAWWYLTCFFSLLVAVGTIAGFNAFYIALGPSKPKWIGQVVTEIQKRTWRK